MMAQCGSFYSLVCLLLIALLAVICKSSIIKVGLQGGYSTKLSFKGLSMGYTLFINLSNQTTWLYPKQSEYQELVSLANHAYDFVRMPFRNDHYEGIEIDINVHFLSDPPELTALEHFYMFVFNRGLNRPIGIKGQLGLGFDNRDELHSLLRQFKRKGLIDSLSFAFAKSKYLSDLYFGGIPLNITSSQYHSFCNVIGLNGHWDCYLSELSITNQGKHYSYLLNTSEYSGYMYFETDTTFIFAPPNFIKRLGDTYLKEELKAGTCSYLYLDTIKQLSCYYADVYQQGNITFVIEDYDYSYDLSVFWSCNLDFCDLNIAENPYGDYWIFGTNFLYRHNLLFDYDNKKVHIYSNRGVQLHITYFKAQLSLFMAILGMLLFGLGWIVIAIRIKAVLTVF